MFHILFSCDRFRDLWNIYIYACMYVQNISIYKLFIHCCRFPMNMLS